MMKLLLWLKILLEFQLRHNLKVSLR